MNTTSRYSRQVRNLARSMGRPCWRIMEYGDAPYVPQFSSTPTQPVGSTFVGRDGRVWVRYVTKSGKVSARPA